MIPIYYYEKWFWLKWSCNLCKINGFKLDVEWSITKETCYPGKWHLDLSEMK